MFSRQKMSKEKEVVIWIAVARVVWASLCLRSVLLHSRRGSTFRRFSWVVYIVIRFWYYPKSSIFLPHACASHFFIFRAAHRIQTAIVLRYSFRNEFSSVSGPRLRGVHLGSSLKRRIALMYYGSVSRRPDSLWSGHIRFAYR